MRMKILRVHRDDAIALRKYVLGPYDYPLVYEHDEAEDTFHLGAFDEDKVVSVGSFFFQKNQNFPGKSYQYRLRGIVTLPSYRNKGHSREIIKTGLHIIKSNQASLLWCQAKTESEEYFQKLGFKSFNLQSKSTPVYYYPLH